MGRDRGKGKMGGRGGGGGKIFIANEDELRIQDALQQNAREARKARRQDDEDEEDEGGAADEDEGGAAGADSVFAFDRSSKPAAGGGDAGGGGAAKSKPAAGGGGGIKVKDLGDALPSVAGDPAMAGMNRKEREALEALKKKEDYQRRHMAGETVEAKKELARLAEVRARREAAAQERAKQGRPPGWTKNGIDEESASSSDEESSEEDDDPETARAKAAAKAVAAAAEAQKAVIAEKKKAAAAAPADPPAGKVAAGGGGGDGGVPKLKAMDIKKMNGDALKDALRERKLDIQGSKKDLMDRLIAHESARV